MLGVPWLPEGWYAVQTRSNSERYVTRCLWSRLAIRTVHPRIQFGSERPQSMFSRYCFIRIEPGDPWHRVRSQHGVSRILGGDRPHPVAEQNWLERLIAILDDDSIFHVDVDFLSEFLPGDSVRVVHPGLFSGAVEAVLWATAQTVAFEAMVMGRSVEVRMRSDQVERWPPREVRLGDRLREILTAAPSYGLVSPHRGVPPIPATAAAFSVRSLSG